MLISALRKQKRSFIRQGAGLLKTALDRREVREGLKLLDCADEVQKTIAAAMNGPAITDDVRDADQRRELLEVS